jgi:hypothetical protein
MGKEFLCSPHRVWHFRLHIIAGRSATMILTQFRR